MYIKELAPYKNQQKSYDDLLKTHPDLPRRRFLAVGWLDRWHSYPKGVVGGPELIEKIRNLCVEPDFDTMGYHECVFCKPKKRPLTSCSHSQSHCAQGHFLGGGEFSITDPHDPFIQYILPDMVIHYIEEHGYCPPRKVLDAIEVRSLAPQDRYENL